ncbi:MAG: ABC transporter permease [Candidatus Zixiibacteriota bacterium]
MERIRTLSRGLFTAGRLGWSIESNWTDPFVFMTYQIVRPIFGALILVFMYKVVTGQPASAVLFAQLYVGNAFFILVIQAMNGIGQTIFEDREHYEMIRYVYLAPIGMGAYLTGRGLAKVTSTTAAIAFTLIAGVFLFGVEFHLSAAGIPYIIVAMLLGIVAAMAFGILLAAVTLVTAQHGFSMAEGASGILFLLSGAVFTPDILPTWVAGISHWVPLTYWLESLRRALLGAPFVESLAALSDGAVLLRLSWTTALVAVLAWLTLRAALHRAVSTGRLDQKTDH